MQVVGRARLELGHQVQIEVARFIGLGVHQKRPATDVLRQLQEPSEHVLQEGGAEPAPLMGGIDPKSRQQGDRLGVPACLPLARSSGVSQRLSAVMIRVVVFIAW